MTAVKTEGSELSGLLGQTAETLTFRGEGLSIAPLKLTQLAGVLTCIDRLSEKGVVELQGPDGIFSTEFNPAKLALRGGEDFIRILAIAARKEVTWVSDLDMVEGARLAGAVWRVNADFFLQHRETLLDALGPAITALLGGVKSLLLGMVRGQAPSSDSSNTATPSETSESTH